MVSTKTSPESQSYMTNLSTSSESSFENVGLGPVGRTAGRLRQDVHVSFEFFPPKSQKMEERLWSTIQKLAPLNPDFVSVTYGAGGTTQEPTHRTVTRLAQETDIKPAAHLTCVGSTKEHIQDVVKGYWDAGVRHIVALRGDPPAGVDAKYEPTPGGYAYSSDLVAGLKDVADFEISVSAYPERHPESGSWDIEFDNLKRKIDAGATRAITQFFFSPETFLRFQDRALSAGIHIPIVPGVMLQPNFKGLKRMSDMCGVKVPDWYAGLFEGLEDDGASRQLITASLVSELTAELYDRGVRHFHLYTLNRAELAQTVARVLGCHHQKEKPAS